MTSFKKIPTLIILLIVLIIFFFNLRPSGNPDIFIWSWLRLSLLSVFFLLSVYLVFSLFRTSLIKLNNYLFFMVVIGILTIEAFVRFKPEVIPNEMLIYLPKAVQQKVALQKGYAVGDLLAGEDLLYHYKPNQDLSNYQFSYLKIDSLGYRNSVELADHVDIIILGDSMMIAEESKRDLGDLFREQGYSALNLGIRGYSPGHYRDAYNKYVIEKNVSHSFVLIFLQIGNDIAESIRYQEEKERGGDYHNYLGEVADRNYKFLPWTLNIVRALPFYLFEYLKKNEDKYIDVELPYKTIKTFKEWQWNHLKEETDLGWRYIKEIIDEINLTAKEKGAVPIVFLIPDPSRVYSQFNDYFKKYDQDYLDLVNLISSHLQAEEVLFVDSGEYLREIIKNDFIFADDTNVHFSTLGVEKFFEVVAAIIKEQNN